MRIVYITPVFTPYKAGMARVARDYADATHAAGHDVIVFTPAYPDRAQETLNYDVVHVRPVIHFGNAAWVRNIHAHVSGVIDVIHLHVPFIGGVYAAEQLSKRFPQARVVITYHMDLIHGGWKRPFFWLWRRVALAKVVEMADVIHVTSRDYFEHSQLFSLVQDQRKIVAIPLAVDDQFGRSFNRYADREKRGLTPEPLFLLVSALDTAHAFKGVKRAIGAFGELVKEYPDAQLVVVGDGDLRVSYESYAHDAGVQDYVKFVGRVSDEELVLWYQMADVTLLPSISSSEAFGMVLVESQGCGTPVIASDLPGVRTVFEADETGIPISSVKDGSLLVAMKRWIELSVASRNDMRVACARHAQGFSKSVIHQRVLDMYERICNVTDDTDIM